MKIRVTLKDPDSMPDSVQAAFDRLEPPAGITEQEWEDIRDERAAVARSDIAERWMKWSEYLVVEFDTEANTATVLPASVMD